MSKNRQLEGVTLAPGLLYFVKDGKLDYIELPDYGQIVLEVQNKAISLSRRTITKKH